MKRIGENLFFLSITLLASCIPAQDGDKNDAIEVLSSGIVNQVTLKIDGKETGEGGVLNIGEYEKSSDPLTIAVTVTNNSSHKINGIELTFNNRSITEFKYKVDDSGVPSFPGFGGTCGRVLAAGSSCLINLQFSSTASDFFVQNFDFKYKNLITSQKHNFSLKIQSGVAASLVFNPNTTIFFFGELTGKAQVPLVERATPQDYEQTLTVENRGELSARNILITLPQDCVSKATGTCPAGHEATYSLTNINCPTRLFQNESCQLKVDFRPLNQGNTPEEKEIRYLSTVSLAYFNDPSNTVGNLRGNFTTVSANLEAIFESTLPSFDFGVDTVVGNRKTLGFKIKNTGYREGILRKILVYDTTDTTLLHYCIKAAGKILECRSAVDDGLLSLEDFPLRFVDKDDCMSITMDKDIPNDSGCFFDIFLQPSVNFLVGASFNYKFRFAYDSKFLDNETLIPVDETAPTALEPVIFESSGTYLGSGKIEISQISYEGIPTVPIEVASNTLYTHDLGKIALQNPAFESMIPLTFTIKNIGESPVSNISFKDGSGVALPLDVTSAIGGTDLGAELPRYYREIRPDSGICKDLQVDATCQVSIQFFPTGRATEALSHSSIYDHIEGIKNTNNYKAFISSYDDGSQFTDLNFTETKDVIQKDVELRFHSIILSKGILGDYQVARPFDSDKFTLEEDYIVVRFRNVGTGTIPYIYNSTGFCNGTVDCGTDDSSNYKIVYASADPSYDVATFGGDFDCADLFDWDQVYAIGDNVAFTMGQACTLKIIAAAKSSNRDIDTAARTEELSRLFLKAPAVNEIWEFYRVGQPGAGGLTVPNIHPLFYDFDIDETVTCPVNNPCDPAQNVADPAFPNGLGKAFINDQMNFEGTFNRTSVKFIPFGPSPYMSSLLYRPAFVKPELRDENNNLLVVAQNIPEYWFYAFEKYELATGETKDIADVGDIHLPGQSQAHVDVLVDGAFACADCEYTIHFGSFPSGESHNLSFLLSNMTIIGNGGIVQSLVTNTFPAEFVLSSGEINVDTDILVGADHPVTVTFTPVGAGISRGFIEITYETGVTDIIPMAPLTRTIKIQLIAESVVDPPSLDVEYNNYELTISADPNIPPIENLVADCDGGGNPCPLIPSLFDEAIANSTSTNRALFSMVKLKNILTNTGYVKKQLTFTNTSAGTVMNDLSFLRRASTVSNTNDQSAIQGFTATGSCFGKTSLVAGESCIIDYKYQPTDSSTSGSFVLTVRYEIAPGQYINQNIQIAYDALTPGNMIACAGIVDCDGASEIPSRIINVAADGSTATAYEINLGTNLVQDAPIKTYNDILTLGNTSTNLRASLLKAWHDYMVNHVATPAEVLLGTEYNLGSLPPLALHPADNQFSLIGGVLYTEIIKVEYPGGATRFSVKASKPCFYGELVDGDLDHNKQGFLGGTFPAADRCVLHITFNMDINYAGREIVNTSPFDDMKDNSFRLPFYSFERSNDGLIIFYFRSKVDPDNSNAVALDYRDVESFSDKRIEFTFPEILPANIGVGDVSGYRVYYSETKTNIESPNAILKNSLEKFLTGDIARVVGASTSVSIDTSDINTLTNGNAYYFRIIAIRDNVDYDAQGFHSIADGSYLSPTDLPTLRVIMPLLNHAYIHSENVLVKTDFELDDGSIVPVDYSDAKSTCSNQAAPVFFDGGSPVAGRNYALISQNMWEYIRINPYASADYSFGFDALDLPHWLTNNNPPIDTPLVIDDYFDGVPGFILGLDNQFFPIEKLSYKRCDDGCTADRLIGGGFYFTAASDFYSVAGESLPFAQARCFMDVSN